MSETVGFRVPQPSTGVSAAHTDPHDLVQVLPPASSHPEPAWHPQGGWERSISMNFAMIQMSEPDHFRVPQPSTGGSAGHTDPHDLVQVPPPASSHPGPVRHPQDGRGRSISVNFAMIQMSHAPLSTSSYRGYAMMTTQLFASPSTCSGPQMSKVGFQIWELSMFHISYYWPDSLQI